MVNDLLLTTRMTTAHKLITTVSGGDPAHPVFVLWLILFLLKRVLQRLHPRLNSNSFSKNYLPIYYEIGNPEMPPLGRLPVSLFINTYFRFCNNVYVKYVNLNVMEAITC